MRNNQTHPTPEHFIIGNKRYDASTGELISTPHPSTSQSPSNDAAQSVHSQVKKSTTLRRAPVSRPTQKQTSSARPKRRATAMDIQPHAQVKRFESVANSGNKTLRSQKEATDTPAHPHPAVQKAHARKTAQLTALKQGLPIPPDKQKEIAIHKAMNTPLPKHRRKSVFKRHPKIFSLATVSIILCLLSGYLLFINLPSLSVTIAARQAGIAATYPSFTPDGYRFEGPARASDGEVQINFQSNTNSDMFTISQMRSSWNSDAVRTMVQSESNGQYITTQDRGLIIFTYNGDAAWVNRGILYTVKGSAPLSGDQLKQIANSF